MNIEELRDYCLSLDPTVEEKFPFAKFKHGENVLVFYICGHMFCFLDIESFERVMLKCQPERIEQLRAEHDFIGDPFNESAKHWIGVDAQQAPTDLMQELIANSFDLVKAKYTPKKKRQ